MICFHDFSFLWKKKIMMPVEKPLNIIKICKQFSNTPVPKILGKTNLLDYTFF